MMFTCWKFYIFRFSVEARSHIPLPRSFSCAFGLSKNSRARFHVTSQRWVMEQNLPSEFLLASIASRVRSVKFWKKGKTRIEHATVNFSFSYGFSAFFPFNFLPHHLDKASTKTQAPRWKQSSWSEEFVKHNEWIRFDGFSSLSKQQADAMGTTLDPQPFRSPLDDLVIISKTSNKCLFLSFSSRRPSVGDN